MRRFISALLALVGSADLATAAALSIPPRAPPALNALTHLNTFALVGTSREAQQQNFGNTSWSYFNQASAQNGRKYQLVYDGGVSGYTTRQFFAGGALQTGAIGSQYGIGLAGALASKARFVVLGGIINDLSAYTAQQLWDATVSGGPGGMGYVQAIAAIVANGQIPVLTLEYGQNGLNTPAKITQIVNFNQLARQYCARGMAVCVDFPAAIWNPSTTTATTINFLANTTQDNTHTNQIGGYLLGKVFDAALSPLVPPLQNLSDGLTDSGLPNSNFATVTGGTFSGAGTLTSGTVPSGWTITAPAGVSVVITEPADPNGYGNDLQIAITNAAGALPVITIGSLFAGSPVAGSQIWGGAYITVASGSTNFVGAACTAQSWYSASWQFSQNDYQTSSVSGYGPTTAYSYTCQTPIPTPGVAQQVGSAVFTATGSSTGISIAPIFTANGSATITIARPWLRLVQ